MKYITSFALIAMFAFGNVATADTLSVRVTTQAAPGVLLGALFQTQTEFADDNMVLGARADMTEGTSTLVFTDLEPGTYGVAVFHDQNGNELLDQNSYGAPTEPFGFSNNPQIGRTAPTFADFSFAFDGTPSTIDITLNGQ